MARGDTAARQIRLYFLLLDSGALSVERAAAALECTSRTIYRDLDGLQIVAVGTLITLPTEILDAAKPRAISVNDALRVIRGRIVGDRDLETISPLGRNALERGR